jgi:hypothetical protein
MWASMSVHVETHRTNRWADNLGGPDLWVVHGFVDQGSPQNSADRDVPGLRRALDRTKDLCVRRWRVAAFRHMAAR